MQRRQFNLFGLLLSLGASFSEEATGTGRKPSFMVMFNHSANPKWKRNQKAKRAKAQRPRKVPTYKAGRFR
jgi:hypothetical protein